MHRLTFMLKCVKAVPRREKVTERETMIKKRGTLQDRGRKGQT